MTDINVNDAAAEQAVANADAERKASGFPGQDVLEKRNEQIRKDSEARNIQADIEAKERSKGAAEDFFANETLRLLNEQRLEKEKLRVPPPISQATSAREARPGEDCVKAIFPRPMFIWAEPIAAPDDNDAHPNLKKRLKVSFGRGVQLVPKSLRNTPYLEHSGVQFFDDEVVKSEGKPYLKGDPKKGPTVEEWAIAGYDPRRYPPDGYENRSTKEEIDEAVEKYKKDKGIDQ